MDYILVEIKKIHWILHNIMPLRCRQVLPWFAEYLQSLSRWWLHLTGVTSLFCYSITFYKISVYWCRPNISTILWIGPISCRGKTFHFDMCASPNFAVGIKLMTDAPTFRSTPTSFIVHRFNYGFLLTISGLI